MSVECQDELEARWDDYVSKGWDDAIGPIEIHAGGRLVALLERETQPRPRRRGEKGCPICGDPGDFVRAELRCPQHGTFGGLR